MVNYVCTRFKDSDGLDLGCHLIPKEYLLEKYPVLQDWIKAPALWVWGRNNNGQLGINNNIFTSSPVQTITGGTNWRSVSLGSSIYGHSAAIKTDGTLWLWGWAGAGRLGDNSIITKSSPVQTVSAGTNWKSVSLGLYHSAAIKTDGALWLWGSNSNGILGNDSGVSMSSPVQTISAGTNWKSASLGFIHSAAIKSDGSLWLWGGGTGGRLGNNSTLLRSSPVQTVSAGTNWKSVSLGCLHSAAIKTDGTLWLWGFASLGRLGDDSATGAKSSPVQTIAGGANWKSVSLGCLHSTAIKTDGSLWVWGSAVDGALGSNSVIDRSSPVQTVTSGTNWNQVSAGSGNTAAIKTDGSLWLWGSGVNGQLGDDTAINKSSPVQTISAGTDWRSVSLGSSQAAAIRNEGGR